MYIDRLTGRGKFSSTEQDSSCRSLHWAATPYGVATGLQAAIPLRVSSGSNHPAGAYGLVTDLPFFPLLRVLGPLLKAGN